MQCVGANGVSGDVNKNRDDDKVKDDDAEDDLSEEDQEEIEMEAP
jgi:hypothetical protein